jgi:hypothetical protein
MQKVSGIPLPRSQLIPNQRTRPISKLLSCYIGSQHEISEISQLVKKHCMTTVESEASLPCPKEFATGPYLEIV